MRRFNFSANLLKPFKSMTLEERATEAKKELISWLSESFGDHRNWDNYIIDRGIEQKQGSPDDTAAARFTAYIYVGDHRYNFSCHIRPSGDNYLGGSFSTTQYRVGEDWMRGNDLPDGSFNKRTFDAIIRSILRTEFKALETVGGKIQIHGANRADRAEAIRNNGPTPGIPYDPPGPPLQMIRDGGR